MAAEYEAFVNRLKELRTEAAETGKDDGHGGVWQIKILFQTSTIKNVLNCKFASNSIILSS